MQNRDISHPTKRTYVLQIFFLKKKRGNILSTYPRILNAGEPPSKSKT